MDMDLEVELLKMDNLKISEGASSTITFVLGSSPNEEKLTVGKSIVDKLSSFLKSKNLDPKENPIVNLPQIEPNVFKLFLQLIPIENLTAEMISHFLSLKSSLHLLDISKMFQILSVQNACRHLFKTELKTFGLPSIVIYEHLKHSHETSLQKFAFSKIQRNLDLVNSDDTFLVKMSRDTWLKLLHVDMEKRENRAFPMCNYSELFLLKMVFKWGFLQCQITGIPVTGVNMRKFIRDILFLILFHRISFDEMPNFEDPLDVIDADFRREYIQHCAAIKKFLFEDDIKNMNNNNNNEKQQQQQGFKNSDENSMEFA